MSENVKQSRPAPTVGLLKKLLADVPDETLVIVDVSEQSVSAWGGALWHGAYEPEGHDAIPDNRKGVKPSNRYKRAVGIFFDLAQEGPTP